MSGRCDSMTGECEGGCQAGWKQSKCDASKDNCSWNVKHSGVLCAYIRGSNIVYYTMFLEHYFIS